jgi:hypothetical protein
MSIMGPFAPTRNGLWARDASPYLIDSWTANHNVCHRPAPCKVLIPLLIAVICNPTPAVDLHQHCPHLPCPDFSMPLGHSADPVPSPILRYPSSPIPHTSPPRSYSGTLCVILRYTKRTNPEHHNDTWADLSSCSLAVCAYRLRYLNIPDGLRSCNSSRDLEA